MASVFIKVPVSESDIHNVNICYDSDGLLFFGEVLFSSGYFCVKVGSSMSWPVITHVLEEIELPTESEVEIEFINKDWISIQDAKDGVKFILNKLKGGKKDDN